MLMVADGRGGLGLADVSKKYLNFGQNFYDSNQLNFANLLKINISVN